MAEDTAVAPAPAVAARGSARERLLAAADELFYRHGMNTVGIDRVIEHAGVAKASLYNAFGSKDELIRAYLRLRFERRQARVTERLAGCATPRDRLLAVFDGLGELFADPGFRGCAFLKASAEMCHGTAVEDICDESRAWLRSLLARLGREAGVPDAETLARQLALLYDGAVAGAQMDRDPAAGTTARDLAVVLIDAAIPAPARTRLSGR